MFFRQYYLDCLSHASYLIGDTTTGRAVVVDPQRDVAEYLADAEAHGLSIVSVLETHFHADFLSGHLELAARTGATIGYGRAAAGRAEFPIETYADGDRIQLGEVELGDPRDPRSHTGVDQHRRLPARHHGPAIRRAHRRHAVHRRCRSPRPARLGRCHRRGTGPATVPLAPRQAADVAGRHQGLPGSRCGIGVWQEPVDRDGVDDRRTTPHQLCARSDERRRVRRSRHPGPVGGPAVLLVRRQPQPGTARAPRPRTSTFRT